MGAASQRQHATRLTSAGEPDPIDAGARRRWVEENCRRNGDPTPRQIATRCLMVRAGWSPQTELDRRGLAWAKLADGHVTTEANPMSAIDAGSYRRHNGQRLAGRRKCS